MQTQKAEGLDLRDLGRRIAGALGKGWELLPGGEGEREMTGAQLWYVHLRAPGGEEIGVRLDRYKARLEVRPSFPRRTDGGYSDWGPSSYDQENPRPAMGVDALKDPAKIAADIKRRFLPAYLEQYQKALARKAETETAQGKRLELAEKLVKALAPMGELSRSRNNNDTQDASFNRLSPLYGELTASHDADTVDIKVTSVPAAVALKIAALLSKVERTDDE